MSPWFLLLCLPAAALGYVIGALMAASGRASESEQHEADMLDLSASNAELAMRTAKLETCLNRAEEDVRRARQALTETATDNARLSRENGALALQLAELTAKNAGHATIPTRPRRSRPRIISTSQPTGSDGEP